MCGIAGILTDKEHTQESLTAVAETMTRCIRHRGPDDHGLWSDPEYGVALGFRRLSIIDLSQFGHQPMHSPSRRFTIVFNGEVYNHTEIRTVLLADGWTFRGHSDSEVICAAFERWGIEDAVRRFVGMFAIAAWDRETSELSLIRDRLGIKPVYYSHRPGHLIFGSELKSLVAVDGFDRSLDQTALASYFRYLYIPAPLTIYQHARKLLPGHILMVSAGALSIPESRPYWSLEETFQRGVDNRFEGSDIEATDELERVLLEAVRLRMAADVPLGALLSGGIDSSTVVALMQANAAGATRTYSIGFPDTVHDESIYAAQIARHLGTQHMAMDVTASDALDVVPLLPEMFDEPLADPSQIPTYLVSKLARSEVTVALSGDGGDELFAGYDRYLLGQRLIPAIERMPRIARRGAAVVAGAASAQAWDRLYARTSWILPQSRGYRLPGQKIRKLGVLLEQDSGNDMYRALVSVWQRPEELAPGTTGAPDVIESLISSGGPLNLLDRMMLLDQRTYLSDDLLAKVDRASMAVSLEARVPLLDHRVVEFSWRLPHRFKIRDGRGKWLLRQVLYRYVEPALVDRPKVGFTVPIAEWLRGPLKGWAEDLIFGVSKDGPLRPEAAHEVWRRFSRGGDELALQVWTVVMFEAWRRRWTD